MLTNVVPTPSASTSALSVKQALVNQQTKVESQALEHITQAVEVALAWVVEGTTSRENFPVCDFSLKCTSGI